MNVEQFQAFSIEIAAVMQKYDIEEGILIVNDDKDRRVWETYLAYKENAPFREIFEIVQHWMQNRENFTFFERIVINK